MSIFIGFAAFFFMEKTLRVLGGGEDSESSHSHSHSHSHTHSHGPEPAASTKTSAKSTSTSISPSQNGVLRARGNDANGRLDPNNENEDENDEKEIESEHHVQMTSKLSAYLNLFGDFVHNMWVSNIVFLVIIIFGKTDNKNNIYIIIIKQ